MTLLLDVSRQGTFFHPTMLHGKWVDVIGCGNVGSQVAGMLTDAGVENVRLFDGDMVGETNVSSQMFMRGQPGMHKTAALQTNIREKTGIEVRAYPEHFNNQVPPAEFVFVCVDSMKARKLIATHLAVSMTELMVESRMGLGQHACYAIRPNDQQAMDRWLGASAYTDEDTIEAQCGVPNVRAVGALVASIAFQRFVYHLNPDLWNGCQPWWELVLPTNTYQGKTTSL